MMAIKLDLNTAVIPVEIGEFKFEIEMTDEKEKAFQVKLKDFVNKAKGLSEDKPEDEEVLRGMVAEVYDELLGEGAFEKLYAYTANTGILLGVFMDLVAEYSKEIRARVMPRSVLNVADQKSATKT